MTQTRVPRRRLQAGLAIGLAIASLLIHGCASQTGLALPRAVSTRNSPAAQEVAPGDAWRLAEAYVAAHAGCDTLVGSGASMMPLYRDRTVLVVRAMKMADLKRGMTVIFVGDQGRPVAHALVARRSRGWVAMGVGNSEPDATLVGSDNYIGTVIKAFAPNPRLASTAVASSVPVDGRRAAGPSQGFGPPMAVSATGDQ